MRIAIYGNNLNQGYFLAQLLRELGADARVFLRPALPLDKHEWWSRKPLDETLVEWVPEAPDVGQPGPLERLDGVRELYRKAKRYDVLVLREEGPALFSELRDVPMVFASQGADLQISPFLMSCYYSLDALTRQLRLAGSSLQGNGGGQLRGWSRFGRGLVRNWPRYRRIQYRQRAGIRDSARVVVFPYQRWLLDRLGIDGARIDYVPLPNTPPEILEEAAPLPTGLDLAPLVSADVLFLHPARLFFVRRNGDRFLKDNDKLLRAFARFVGGYSGKARLALVKKGFPEDVAASEDLVSRLGIQDHVVWLPELPNYALLRLFRLPNVVICDQFSPFVNTLGNLGRESVYFGLPLISSYDGADDVMYTSHPPNVLLGNSDETILDALRRSAEYTGSTRQRLKAECSRWYEQNLDPRKNAAKYLDLCRKAAAERGSGAR